jgi:hypothetical protein
MTWTLWKMIVKDGKDIAGDWQNFTVSVGDDHSSKRRKYRLAFHSQTGRFAEGKELHEMKLKYPELLEKILHNII